MDATLPLVMRAPALGAPARATVATALDAAEHLRTVRAKGDHEAADSEQRCLYARALDAVLHDVLDARALVRVARRARAVGFAPAPRSPTGRSSSGTRR
jgi:hypothetical protein